MWYELRHASYTWHADENSADRTCKIVFEALIEDDRPAAIAATIHDAAAKTHRTTLHARTSDCVAEAFQIAVDEFGIEPFDARDAENHAHEIHFDLNHELTLVTTLPDNSLFAQLVLLD